MTHRNRALQTVVCRNPFLNLQAYDSSDDEDEQTLKVSDDKDFIAGGDDDEDGSWEAGDGVGDIEGTGGIQVFPFLTPVHV